MRRLFVFSSAGSSASSSPPSMVKESNLGRVINQVQEGGVRGGGAASVAEEQEVVSSRGRSWGPRFHFQRHTEEAFRCR